MRFDRYHYTHWAYTVTEWQPQTSSVVVWLRSSVWYVAYFAAQLNDTMARLAGFGYVAYYVELITRSSAVAVVMVDRTPTIIRRWV